MSVEPGKSVDILSRSMRNGIILAATLQATENALLNMTPEPIMGQLTGLIKGRDNPERRQKRLIFASQGACEAASAYFIASLLPNLNLFPVAALVQSKNATHPGSTDNGEWQWHTGILVNDGAKWHAISPANYEKDQPKRFISGSDLQEVLGEFTQVEQREWPAASYIIDQLPRHQQPYIERVTSSKGFNVPLLRVQKYVRNGNSDDTVLAGILRNNRNYV